MLKVMNTQPVGPWLGSIKTATIELSGMTQNLAKLL